MTDDPQFRPTVAQINEALERSDRKRGELVAGLEARLVEFDDEVFRTGRGFAHMHPVPSSYGGEVAVYESSNAEHPHIWVKVKSPADMNNPEGEMWEAVAHLPIEGARLLHKQLGYLVENHYQRHG